MATKDYFSHTQPDGRNVFDILTAQKHHLVRRRRDHRLEQLPDPRDVRRRGEQPVDELARPQGDHGLDELQLRRRRPGGRRSNGKKIWTGGLHEGPGPHRREGRRSRSRRRRRRDRRLEARHRQLVRRRRPAPGPDRPACAHYQIAAPGRRWRLDTVWIGTTVDVADARPGARATPTSSASGPATRPATGAPGRWPDDLPATTARSSSTR